MTSRKGIGYMIEAIVAVITVLVFVIGNTPSAPDQDWNSFQRQIETQDLGYTLKKSGDTTDLLKRHETGSYQTVVSALSEGNIEVSGTITNLPKSSGLIGFHVTDAGDHEDSIVDAGSICGGDLEEIDNVAGTTIKRTQDRRFGTHLYIANTGSEVGEGYDTLWVDNQTECQFSSAEGPFYIDEVFKWGNSTNPDEYGYYDFKDVINNNNTLKYYNATVMTRVKNTVAGKINGVQVNQKYDTFRLSEDDISVYSLAVFKGSNALDDIDASADTRDKLQDFMLQKPVLLLMNLTENDFQDHQFLRETGLKHVGMSEDETPSGVSFSNNAVADQVQTYFQGMNGKIDEVKLKPGGHVTSSIGDTITGDNTLMLAKQGRYQIEDWNSSNWDMNPVQPDSVDGKPDTSCITDPSQSSTNLTEGSFTFPSGASYSVINTELGGSLSYCEDRDVRALNIDRDGDNNYTEDGEGPFLNGETVYIDDRKYRVKIYPPTGGRAPGDSAEFVFNGVNTQEVVNYRTSFEDSRGGKLVRIAHMDYTEEDRKVIAASIYWLLGDTTTFGEQESSQVTTEIIGSVKNYTYMPYRLSLRWR